MALGVKNLPAKAGDIRDGFNPCVEKIPWRRAWQPLQYFCLENSMDRGAWQAIVHRVAESQIQLKRLSTHTCITLVTKENLLYNTENGGDLNGKET